MQERIQEKHDANKKPLFKKYFALHISPIFLAILFSVNFKCSFHDKFSSNRMPRNFIDDCLFITWLLTLSFLTLHLLFSSYWCLTFVELLVSQKSSFSIIPVLKGLIKSFGNTSGKSSLLLIFLFLTFKESLFEINHSLIFSNSLLTVDVSRELENSAQGQILVVPRMLLCVHLSCCHY